MNRPTALIRQLLLLELKQHTLTGELRRAMRELQRADVAIVEREDRPQEIWVRYKVGQKWCEGTYMRAMLDAELGMTQERGDFR